MRSERLAIHPYMLTMRFARCPAAAQDASQRTTDGVFQVCGGQWGRLVLVGAQLQTGPTAALQTVWPSITNAWLCVLWGEIWWLLALPRAHGCRGVGCVRLAASGCV